MANNQKVCRHCKETIDKQAKRCPKFGGKLGIPTWAKILIVIAVIIFCIVKYTGGCAKAIDDSIKDTENSYKDVTGKTSFNVGETFENKYIKITYDNVNTDFKNYSKYADVKSGYKVIQLTFSAENIGETDQVFSAYDFKGYADGAAVESFWSVDDSAFTDTLSKGKKSVNKHVYFEVPKDAEKITVEYDASWLDIINIEFVVK